VPVGIVVLLGMSSHNGHHVGENWRHFVEMMRPRRATRWASAAEHLMLLMKFLVLNGVVAVLHDFL
jgi:hypothetical protein